MRKKILQAVQEALEGSRKVKITFKPEAIDYVKFLLGLALVGKIEIGANKLVIGAIVDSHAWSGDHNRTFIIALTDKFSKDEFAGSFQHALEKIEVAV
jgi:hypothetical protein